VLHVHLSLQLHQLLLCTICLFTFCVARNLGQPASGMVLHVTGMRIVCIAARVHTIRPAALVHLLHLVHLCCMRLQAAEIKSGMDIFNIPQPPYKELLLIERELELLDKMWSLVAEWEATYNGWKDGLFRDLKVGINLTYRFDV
jgi:hypothetical protein